VQCRKCGAEVTFADKVRPAVVAAPPRWPRLVTALAVVALALYAWTRVTTVYVLEMSVLESDWQTLTEFAEVRDCNITKRIIGSHPNARLIDYRCRWTWRWN